MPSMLKGTIPLVLLLLFCAGCGGNQEAGQDAVLLKVGHVGHDHHSALFVALDAFQAPSDKCKVHVKPVKDKERYTLFDGERKLADLEVVKVGGGSKMPTALAQGVIDLGLGGVAPVLASTDSGAPVRLIAPLHAKGDMLVVNPDFPAQDWATFVSAVKASEKPIRVGYKSPVAVAKVIFEAALDHEKIPYGADLSDQAVKVQLVNVKGGGKLNVSLSQGAIDAYVGNNPFPSIAVEKKLGRIISDLEDLPPGAFRDHPCCCVAANVDALKDKSEAAAAVLALLSMGTGIINQDLDKAIPAVSRWIGTSEAVEKMSMPTSGYAMEDSEAWHGHMATWFDAMGKLGFFKGTLKGKTEKEAAALAYDFSFLKEAARKIAP